MEICIRSLFVNVYICIYFVTFVIYTECNDKYGVECLFSLYLNRQSTYAGQVSRVSCWTLHRITLCMQRNLHSVYSITLDTTLTSLIHFLNWCYSLGFREITPSLIVYK